MRLETEEPCSGPLVKRGFRSLEELLLDFKHRRARRFRSLRELTEDFERRQTVPFRSLDELTREFEKRRGRNEPLRNSVQGPKASVYDRVQLLGVLAALPKDAEGAPLGIFTARVPPPALGARAEAQEAVRSHGPGAGAGLSEGLENPRGELAKDAGRGAPQGASTLSPRDLDLCASTAASGESTASETGSRSGDCEVDDGKGSEPANAECPGLEVDHASACWGLAYPDHEHLNFMGFGCGYHQPCCLSDGQWLACAEQSSENCEWFAPGYWRVPLGLESEPAPYVGSPDPVTCAGAEGYPDGTPYDVAFSG